jgi:hypothetical protein
MKTMTIPARKLTEGMTLAFANPRFNYRVDDVQSCRDGQIKVYGSDYTSTEWFDADQNVWIEVSK